MRVSLLVWAFWMVASGLLAQGPHLDVAQSGKGLRVSNPGALSVSGDTQIELRSEEMVFTHPNLLIGALGGGRSVWLDLEPTFLDGRCRGLLRVKADGRNVPQLEFGPYEIARPAPRVDVRVLKGDDGWRQVLATAEADDRSWTLSATFSEAIRLSGDGVRCGEAHIAGHRCGFSPGTPMEASWSVQGGPGPFELQLRSNDGCEHTVEGVLQGE